MRPLYSCLCTVLYICVFSYMKSSKLSQGQSWGDVKLDLKQIVMKGRKTEEKMLTQEKLQSVGKRKWKIRGLELISLGTRTEASGVCCCWESLVTEGKSSLRRQGQAQQTKNSWMAGKTLVLKLLWNPEVWRNQERCGDFTWKTFWGDAEGKGNIFCQDETVEVSKEEAIF